MPSRKRSAWTWIVLTLIGVPVLYVLSFGPACWYSTRTTGFFYSYMTAPRLYSPIGRLAVLCSDNWIGRAISNYATKGNEHEIVVIPLGNADFIYLTRDSPAEFFHEKRLFGHGIEFRP